MQERLNQLENMQNQYENYDVIKIFLEKLKLEKRLLIITFLGRY